MICDVCVGLVRLPYIHAWLYKSAHCAVPDLEDPDPCTVPIDSPLPLEARCRGSATQASMDRESPNPGNISSGSGGTALIPGFKTHRRWLAGIMRLVRKVKRRGVPVSQPGRTGGRGGICKLLRKRLQQGKGNAPLAPVQEEEEVVDVVLEDVPPVGVTEIRLDPVPPGPPQVLDGT